MQKMDGSTFQKYFIKSGRNKESKKENIVVSFCKLILNFKKFEAFQETPKVIKSNCAPNTIIDGLFDIE